MAAVLAISGCVSTKTTALRDDAQATTAGKTLVVSSRKRPDFAAMTAGKAGFGMIGAFAMISAGNKIVADHHLEDPAIYIGHELGKALAAERQLQILEMPAIVADGTDVRKLAGVYRQADLLLDIQTVNWSFGYFATDWNNYRVIYSAKLRLIETRTGKLLAEGFCSRVPEKEASSPSYEQLMADDAAVLKAELQHGAETCVSQLKSKVFALS